MKPEFIEVGDSFVLPLNQKFWEVYTEFKPSVVRSWLIVHADQTAAIKDVAARAFSMTAPVRILACSDAMKSLQVDYCVVCGNAILTHDLIDVDDTEPVHLECVRL